MWHIIVRSFVLILLLSLLLSGAYPLLVAGLGRVFAWRADGSLIRKNGVVIGSELIGQAFHNPAYFQARPSAVEYGAGPPSSGGSSLGPLNRNLSEEIAVRISRLLSTTPAARGRAVPIDLITASASGLDPHISPQAAEIQAERIAHLRHAPVTLIRELITSRVEIPLLGILGEPRVNVLLLNLELDQKWGSAPFRRALLSKYRTENQRNRF